LGDEAGDYAEKAIFVEVMHAKELVETIDAARGPGFGGFDGEIALRGFEFNAEAVGDQDGFVLVARG
jgi:hypothetical protein